MIDQSISTWLLNELFDAGFQLTEEECKKVNEIAERCTNKKGRSSMRDDELMNPEPHPPVVMRVRVMGKDWQLLYMSLPVGTHDLYAREFSYRASAQPQGSITFTREEIQKHEKYCDELRAKIMELDWEAKHFKALKLPPPCIDSAVAFHKWYGFVVSEDMDIQTQVAWENWQIAWNAALEAKKLEDQRCKVNP